MSDAKVTVPARPKSIYFALDLDDNLINGKTLNKKLLAAIADFGFSEIIIFTQRDAFLQYDSIFLATATQEAIPMTIGETLQAINTFGQEQKIEFRVAVSSSADPLHRCNYYSHNMQSHEVEDAKIAQQDALVQTNRATNTDTLRRSRSDFFKRVAQELVPIINSLSEEQQNNKLTQETLKLFQPITKVITDKSYLLTDTDIANIKALHRAIYPMTKIDQYRYLAAELKALPNEIMLIDNSQANLDEIAKAYGGSAIASLAQINSWADAKTLKTKEQYLEEFRKAESLQLQADFAVKLSEAKIELPANVRQEVISRGGEILQAYAYYCRFHNRLRQAEENPTKKAFFTGLIKAMLEGRDAKFLSELIETSKYYDKTFERAARLLGTTPTYFYRLAIAPVQTQILQITEVIRSQNARAAPSAESSSSILVSGSAGATT